MSGAAMAGDARATCCWRSASCCCCSRSSRARVRVRNISPTICCRWWCLRRCGRRIPAVAAVRHLDLFPADAAGAGGFPVGHRLARTARRAGCGRRRGLAARGRQVRCRAGPRARLVPVPEPVPAPPAPASSMPAAASVAESVLRDHPEPTPAQPGVEVVPHAPSPEVPSPGLQPGNGSSTAPDAPPH